MSIPKVTLLFGDYANGFGIDSLEILVSSGDPAQTIVGEAQEYDPSPSILIDASNVTIGAPHAGMTIVASPPAAGGYGLPSEAIELGGPGVSNVTIQGNTIDPFGGGGTFSYGSYGIVTSPGDDNLTIGGFAAGAGNTFVGGSLDGIQVPEDPYAVWVQGAVDDPGPANALVWYGTASTNANIIGNSF